MHQVTFTVQIVYRSNNARKHRSEELFRELVSAVLILECPETLPERLVHQILMLAVKTVSLKAVKTRTNVFPPRMLRFNLAQKVVDLHFMV
jgi:hypothetical protein